MALISLGLDKVQGPPLQVRSDQWSGLLSPLEQNILTGSSGTWSPGVLAACVSRLSGVLSAGDVDPALLGLLPWIARQVVERGECVLLLDDALSLRPVSAYELTGSSSGRTYRTLTVNGPDRSQEYRNVSPSQVVHSVIRPVPNSPWRGQHWRQTGGIVASQLRAAVDAAIEQEGKQPRGSLLPVVAAESPQRLTKLMGALMRLKGGLSSHPLLGRQGENPGPSPTPVRLQTNTLPELLRAREDLSAALAESLGFSRVTLGIGVGGQVSRPDGLRTWIATTATAWADTLKNELERVLERPVVLSLEPVLAGLVPLGLRVGAAARLVAAGWTKPEAERIVRLS